MNQEIQQALKKMSFLLKRDLPDETTSVTIFINCEEIRIDISQRLPEQLREQGISMRNISGKWIR